MKPVNHLSEATSKAGLTKEPSARPDVRVSFVRPAVRRVEANRWQPFAKTLLTPARSSRGEGEVVPVHIKDVVAQLAKRPSMKPKIQLRRFLAAGEKIEVKVRSWRMVQFAVPVLRNAHSIS